MNALQISSCFNMYIAIISTYLSAFKKTTHFTSTESRTASQLTKKENRTSNYLPLNSLYRSYLSPYPGRNVPSRKPQTSHQQKLERRVNSQQENRTSNYLPLNSLYRSYLSPYPGCNVSSVYVHPLSSKCAYKTW